MKQLSAVLMLILIPLLLNNCAGPGKAADGLKLWYRQPAMAWEEALPAGNGRLGAMVFGDPVNEHLQLNEESIWAGSKINNNNPDALRTLPSLRKALFESRYRDALKLAGDNFLGTPPNIRSYQPLGDLLIGYEWNGIPQDYYRELNLGTGIITTTFTVEGKKVKEEVFASAPGDIIVVHIVTDKGLPLNASFRMNRAKDAVVRASDNGRIRLTGQIIDNEDPASGPGGEHMKFAGELRLTALKGAVSSNDSTLIVRGAEEITVRLTGASDYNIDLLDYDRSRDPQAICSEILNKSDNTLFSDLVKAHLAEYSRMFDRVSLSFGPDTLAAKPTDERLMGCTGRGRG